VLNPGTTIYIESFQAFRLGEVQLIWVSWAECANFSKIWIVTTLLYYLFCTKITISLYNRIL